MTQTIPLDPRYRQRIRSGRKRSTVRRGWRDYTSGPSVLDYRDGEVDQVNVTEVRHVLLPDLGAADAQMDGFATLAELYVALAEHYPGITPDERVTVVSWQAAP